MLRSILPTYVYNAIIKYSLVDVYEIRLRDEKPIYINLKGKYLFLESNSGAPIILQSGECAKILAKATDYSLYSVNNQIIKGFITVKSGIRIGVCGETVIENGFVKTIKNCSSLNVRIPHEVIGCANEIYDKISFGNKNIYNTLIISPPGRGKTTILRDLSRIISNNGKNVLIVDERKEIAAISEGKPFYDVGSCSDVISNSDKNYAFSYAIRSMSPEVIVTDELQTESDVEAISLSGTSGVSVIASVHAKTIDELERKDVFVKLKNCIERYVILSNEGQIGKIMKCYNQSLVEI